MPPLKSKDRLGLNLYNFQIRMRTYLLGELGVIKAEPLV